MPSVTTKRSCPTDESVLAINAAAKKEKATIYYGYVAGERLRREFDNIQDFII